MGSGRRDRRKDRAREFGARFATRHPRLAVAIIGILIAGLIVTGAAQVYYGAYLGRSWIIAAFAGVATAAGLSAAIVIANHRNSLTTLPLLMTSLALWALSVTVFRIPFPQRPYGHVQAFFNVLHAALLGYDAAAGTAAVIFLAYVFLHTRAFVPTRTAPVWSAPDRGGLPARLRFPSATEATWRAGRVIAANGTVTWRSLNGDSEVDLTSACEAQPASPTDTRKRQPRTTTLATAAGLVELDVSPIALETLAGRPHRPRTG